MGLCAATASFRVDNGELSLITTDGGDLSSTHNIPNEVYARYYTSDPYTQDARHT
jgi:hypothetical protein